MQSTNKEPKEKFAEKADHLYKYIKETKKEEKENKAKNRKKKYKKIKPNCSTTSDRKIDSTIPPEVVESLVYKKKEHQEILTRFTQSNQLDKSDESGNTVFHLAAARRRPQLIKYFMDKGDGLIDTRNKEEWTPLMLAVKMALSGKKNGESNKTLKERMGVIHQLLRKNANGISESLAMAAQYGDLKVFKKLFAKAEEKDWTAFFQGTDGSFFYSPPLMHAMFLGGKEVVRWFVKHAKMDNKIIHNTIVVVELSEDSINPLLKLSMITYKKKEKAEIVEFLKEELRKSGAHLDDSGGLVREPSSSSSLSSSPINRNSTAHITDRLYKDRKPTEALPQGREIEYKAEPKNYVKPLELALDKEVVQRDSKAKNALRLPRPSKIKGSTR